MHHEQDLDKESTRQSTELYQQMALNVGANFAQSIVSETYKQTVFANAAGLAAVLAYLANNPNHGGAVLVAGAGMFLLGVALTLLGMMFTYVNTSRVLRKMLRTATRGEKFERDHIDRVTGFLGDSLAWLGIIAFCCGAAMGGYGLYGELMSAAT